MNTTTRLLLLFWTAGLMAQTSEIKNPRTSAADVAAGARIFRSHCAQCHGLNAAGGRGPSLANGIFYHGSSDADLLRNISEGIPGTEMPGVFFSDNQVWQVVAYLRSLSRKAERAPTPGDPAQGAKLFAGKGRCVQCHRVNGQGGRLGPDLSAIGSLRSPDHLRTSILDPSADVPPRYWVTRVRHMDGSSYSGFILNEDTHTLQIIDMREELRSFAKSELDEMKVEKSSSMPSYRGVLEESELRDVVAYLSSLQRKGRGR